VRTTPEEKRRQYRTIFECLNKNPRIKPGYLSKILKIRPSVASRRIRDACDLGYVIGPQLRKKSYKNFTEYVYVIKCEDPLDVYERYTHDKNIIYHTMMDGEFTLWVVSEKKIDSEGTIIGGPRSDYYVSFPPDHSWNQAIKTMQEMVETFDPGTYGRKGFIENHWGETVEWGKEDEILYREFKYNLRKPLDTVARNHKIWVGKAYEWLKKLPEYCTIATTYFPESIKQYDPYLFVIDTCYEDFIIDLFSKLPVSVLFLKVSNKLFMDVHIDRGSMRSVDFRSSDISKLHIPLLMRELKKKEIIKKEMHAVVQCYWREDAF
jgi:hypothetical protein